MFEALGLLDPHKAIGIDSTESRILKIVQLVFPNNSYLHTLILCKCVLPLEWFNHCIVLVFKTGDKIKLTLMPHYHFYVV